MVVNGIMNIEYKKEEYFIYGNMLKEFLVLFV